MNEGKDAEIYGQMPFLMQNMVLKFGHLDLKKVS